MLGSAEQVVFGHSHLEVEIDVAMLEKYRLPGNDQIPAELIQAGGETLVSVIHTLINSICNKITLTVVSLLRCHCYQLHIKFNPVSFSLG
jgi:hypothetical protein